MSSNISPVLMNKPELSRPTSRFYSHPSPDETSITKLPSQSCNANNGIRELSIILACKEPLTESQRVRLESLAWSCYESWCLTNECRHDPLVRVAGLILLARVCLRIGRNKQGLVHARRAWQCLRGKSPDLPIRATLSKLIIDLNRGFDEDAADHWQHINSVIPAQQLTA